ncbi:MAG: DUF4412 domain-containing protein [Acidithiobacillales bacterium]
MKRILEGVIVLLLAAGTARADFEGVADMKITSSGGPGGEAVSGSGRVYISKTGWRYEVEMSNPEVAKMTGGRPFRMCMVGKISNPDVVYSINDAMKTYSVINTKEMRELAARAKAGEETFDVQKLGKAAVAGLPCQNVRISSKSRKTVIEACVSKEFVSGDWLRAMQGDQGGEWLKALKNAGVEGYPLRLTMTRKGQPGSQTSMEITKLDRKGVPAAMFEVPPGYEQKSMMENMAQSPEQARQMEDARKQLQREMEKMTPEQRKMMEEMLKKQAPPKQ